MNEHSFYGTLGSGLMVELKPVRISAKRLDLMKQAFLSAVTIDEDGGHWRYEPDPGLRPGVGVFEGQPVNLLRFSWFIFNGETPVGANLKAICGGSPTANTCYNPEHRILLLAGQKSPYCSKGHLFDDEAPRSENGYRRCYVCRPLKPEEIAA